MKLIVGLGNPGKQFNKTRHNIGFETLDFIREEFDLPKFKLDKKLKAEITKNENFILVKPQTFMNNSGESVIAIKKYYKVRLSDIIIIRDDVDIMIGKVKSKKGSAGAGHKGIRSIIQHLKSKNFWQIKIGVANELIRKKIPTEKFVLQKFEKDELAKIDDISQKTMSELEKII